MTDADTLSRLAVARGLVEHGGLPQTDSFTIDTGRERPHHSEWLGDLYWLGLWHVRREPALQLGRLVPICAAMLLTVRYARAIGASIPVAVFVLIAFLPAAASRFTERNDIHAYWLVPLFGVVLEASVRRPRLWLTLLPLGWLWAQLHASFIVGPALIAAFMVRSRLLRSPIPWKLAIPAVVLLPIMPLLGPAGTGPYRQLLDHVLNAHVYRQLLVEWSPATSSPALLALLPLHASALALLCLLPAREQRPLLPCWTLAVLGVASAYVSRRFIPYAALLCGPAIAALLTGSRGRFPRLHRPVVAVIAIAAVLVLAGTATYVVRSRRLPSVLSAPAALPARFLAQNAAPVTRLFNAYNVGPWLLWFHRRNVRHFADPRNSGGAERLATYVRMLETPAFFDRQATALAINATLLSLQDWRQARLVDWMDASRDWELVYWDGAFIIFVRASPPFGTLVAKHGFRVLRGRSTRQNLFATSPATGAAVDRDLSLLQSAPDAETLRTCVRYVRTRREADRVELVSRFLGHHQPLITTSQVACAVVALSSSGKRELAQRMLREWRGHFPTDPTLSGTDLSDPMTAR